MLTGSNTYSESFDSLDQLFIDAHERFAYRILLADRPGTNCEGEFAERTKDRFAREIARLKLRKTTPRRGFRASKASPLLERGPQLLEVKDQPRQRRCVLIELGHCFWRQRAGTNFRC